MENWSELTEYPGYSVSDIGQVRNDETGRILALLQSQRHVTHVGLMLGKVQVKRSVAVLVANAFVERPNNPNFNTPIHLNGDRSNCCAGNLMWRPRWYAIKYHRQFLTYPDANIGPVRDINTGEVFDDIWIPVFRYGILLSEIVISATERTVVWPTMQRFEWVSTDIN